MYTFVHVHESAKHVFMCFLFSAYFSPQQKAVLLPNYLCSPNSSMNLCSTLLVFFAKSNFLVDKDGEWSLETHRFSSTVLRYPLSRGGGGGGGGLGHERGVIPVPDLLGNECHIREGVVSKAMLWGSTTYTCAL